MESSRLCREELGRFREAMAEMASAHPALAPLLGGNAADPDVERLLEGVAFLNGLLRRKLDHDLPEFLDGLAQLFAPQFLQPIPATTVVAFSPAATLAAGAKLPAGVELASAPIEGTRCTFRTCAPVELHPLTLTEQYCHQPPGGQPAITLGFRLHNLNVADWSPTSLRLFLGGDYASAAELHYLLRRHLRRIVIGEEQGEAAVLPPDSLQTVGFSPDEALLPYPSHADPACRLLREFFTSPQRFLFLELGGLERWQRRGASRSFSLRFEFGSHPRSIPAITSHSFVLHATPAVNTFRRHARPIVLDHRKERHLLHPDGLAPGHAQVFGVERVTGLQRGTGVERQYLSFGSCPPSRSEVPLYHTARLASPDGKRSELYLSVTLPPQIPPATETLAVDLCCSNGSLPEALCSGDLCEVTDALPAVAAVSDVQPVTPALPPAGADRLLGLLLSQLKLNRTGICDVDCLRNWLALCLTEDPPPERCAAAAGRRKIDALEELAVHGEERLLEGLPVRGTETTLQVRGEEFAGVGDLFLFGTLLDELLAGTSPLGRFTRLTVFDVTRGATLSWPARLGGRLLG